MRDKTKGNGWRSEPGVIAALVTVGWTVFTVLMVLFVDKVWVSLLSLMLCFGFIYPAACLAVFFLVGRRHGLLWYLYGGIMTIDVVLYVLWDSFRAVMPNMIIMTALCLVFGCGIGSCFMDKDRVMAEREARRLRRTGEDQPYESILGDEENKKGKR